MTESDQKGPGPIKKGEPKQIINEINHWLIDRERNLDVKLRSKSDKGDSKRKDDLGPIEREEIQEIMTGLEGFIDELNTVTEVVEDDGMYKFIIRSPLEYRPEHAYPGHERRFDLQEPKKGNDWFPHINPESKDGERLQKAIQLAFGFKESIENAGLATENSSIIDFIKELKNAPFDMKDIYTVLESHILPRIKKYKALSKKERKSPEGIKLKQYIEEHAGMMEFAASIILNNIDSMI